MSVINQVGAAVGGDPFTMRQYRREISKASISDEGEILPQFKIIQLEPDLSLFAFYSSECNWHEDFEDLTWRHLKRIASRLKLSWVFLRAGENITDGEYESNEDTIESEFDRRLYDLFDYQHSVIIQPELSNKFY